MGVNHRPRAHRRVPGVAHEEKDGGTPSATDARWAAMVVAHDEGGIEITDIALERSDNEGVRAVAAESEQDQKEELLTLRAISAAGGLEPMMPPEPLARFNEQTLERLRTVPEAEFDLAWLDVLPSHGHEQQVPNPSDRQGNPEHRQHRA